MPSERPDLLNAPAYSAPDAARILNLPKSTVRNWSFGQQGRVRADQARRFPAVISAADPARKLLSFSNLCELHVLSAIRREHRVALPVVRKSVDFVRKQMKSARPLLDVDFSTNGVSLFVERASQLLNVSQEGQLAMRGEFKRALVRIKRDRAGAPVRLFPFTRIQREKMPQPEIIAIDPTIAFGRPMLAQAGVKTEVIASRFAAGDAPKELAVDYGVSEADILEALRYEQRWAQAA